MTRYPNLLTIIAVIVSVLAFSQSAFAATFAPSKTWLFVVGVLQFKDANTTSWGSKNRRDSQIVSLFKSRGVPADHIVYIKDSQATDSNVKTQFKNFLARTQANDLLITYYTGHGSDGYFETYDGKWWEMSSIVSSIESTFHGSSAILLGDCCQSGSLADAIKDVSGRVAYAIMSSSSKTEEGHGNWTFSQALLDGLTGDPICDTNKDGRINVKEIADHIRNDILSYENNHSTFRTQGNFDADMVLASATTRTSPDPQPVEVLYNGNWWKAKLMERNGKQARIRWIQLGYDAPDQEEWVETKNVRQIK